MSSNKDQYVRAGACTAGTSHNSRLVQCALELDDCPVGSTFWSASQLTAALASDAATCLQAAQTNAVLGSQCGDGNSNASTRTGSCLVEDFQARTIYQCAVSRAGCAAGDTYLTSSQTQAASGGVTCNLCGLDASMDYDLSDVDGHDNFLDNLVGSDSSKQLEAVGIAGIVIGLIAGCCLLICLQRMCRKCCGGRRRRRDGEAKASSAATASGSSNGANDLDKEADYLEETTAADQSETKDIV